MRVQELFESSANIKHGSVVEIITGLAIAFVKTTVDKKVIAYEGQNDRFWSSAIDEVTRSLERFVSNPNEKTLARFEDEASIAIDEVAENIVGYYSNRWNHEPGFKPPKISYNGDTVSITKVRAAFNAIPAFATAFKEMTATRKAEEAAKKKAHHALVTANSDEKLKALGVAIDETWAKSFSAEIMAKINKNPHHWDFPKGTVVKNEKELLAAIKAVDPKAYLRHVTEWVMNDVDGKFDTSNGWMWQILRSPVLLNKLASYSKKLGGLQ